MNMKRIFVLVLSLCICAACTSCGRKKTQKKPAPPAPPVVKTEVVGREKERKEDVKYEYKGADYRDPFIPVGASIGGMGTGEVDITLLALKGIVESIATGKRFAVLSAPGGINYVTRDGKLVDPRDKVVPGIAVIVKKDRVILITKDSRLKEFVLREEGTSSEGFKKENSP